jgi:uncharacterized protein
MISGELPHFEFDAAKDCRNFAKHGIAFVQAERLWADPFLWVQPANFPTELRYIAIGLMDERHWTAIYTLRLGRIRIISLRRSRYEEQKKYEEKKRANDGS